VYAVGHANPPLNGRFLAAVKACGPTAVLSHFSAAALYGFLAWDDRYPEITGPKAHNHPAIRAHRAALDPRDTHAQALRLVSMRQVTDVLARSRGAANLAKVVADGPAPTRSELEDAVLDLITKEACNHPTRRAPSPPRGPRRARRPCHLEPGDPLQSPDARAPHASRRS
jgi:hypothetical protein